MKKRIKRIIERINAYLKNVTTASEGGNYHDPLIGLLLAEEKIKKEDLEKIVHSYHEWDEEKKERKLHDSFIRLVYQFLDHLEIEESELKSAEYLRSIFEITENTLLKYPENEKLIEELIMSQSHLINLDGIIDSEEQTLKTRTILILNITEDKYSQIEKRIIKLNG